MHTKPLCRTPDRTPLNLVIRT